MKTKLPFLLLCLAFCLACEPTDDSNDDSPGETPLVGQDGNPRFNLQFTNPENVDLDLYVRTPNGNIISYENPSADRGELDVDCLCGDCPQGPNENIFWENGTAPSGTYEYWVDYFGDCGSTGAISEFVLRVIRNGEIMETRTGSMNGEGSSTVWTFQQ